MDWFAKVIQPTMGGGDVPEQSPLARWSVPQVALAERRYEIAFCMLRLGPEFWAQGVVQMDHWRVHYEALADNALEVPRSVGWQEYYLAMRAVSNDFQVRWDVHERLRQALGAEACDMAGVQGACPGLVDDYRTRRYFVEERVRYQVAFTGAPDQMAAVALIERFVPGTPQARWALLRAGPPF